MQGYYRTSNLMATKIGSSLFWYDNWTCFGALYSVTPPDLYCGEAIHNVYDVVNERGWDEDILSVILPHDLIMHILDNAKQLVAHDVPDKPCWSLEPKGEFSVKSACEYLRSRRDSAISYKNTWVKGLSLKLSFFM